MELLARCLELATLDANDHDGKWSVFGGQKLCVALATSPRIDYVRACHWLSVASGEWKPFPHGALGIRLLDKGEEALPPVRGYINASPL